MSSWYESRIDRAIREAEERGDFDDLPGTGQPLPDRGELHDENWWVRQLVVRENLTGLAPATLRLRKEIEDLPQRVASAVSEYQVRAVVAELNARIERSHLGLLDGPPVVLDRLDPDDVVQVWRERRDG